MRVVGKMSMTVGALLSLAGGVALAAADYYLKIDGVEGESSAPENIEVQSFSWGASNPTSVGSSGLSAGRVNAQDAPRSTSAPRDAASGQATGRRAPTATAAGVAADPKAGEVATFVVTVRESPTRSSTGSSLARACAAGKHFPSATLTANGRSYTMQDVMVSSCALSGETRTAELKGHVTLIK